MLNHGISTSTLAQKYIWFHEEHLLYPLSLKGEKSGLKSISRKEEKRNAEKYSANTIGKGQTIKDPY